MSSKATSTFHDGAGSFPPTTSPRPTTVTPQPSNNLTPPHTPSSSSHPTSHNFTKSIPNTSSSLNQNHWQCIINMETNRDRVLSAPVGDLFEVIRSLVQGLAFVLSWGVTRLYLGVCAVFSLVSLKVLMMFVAVSIVTFVFFVIPYRHRSIVTHRKPHEKLWPRKEANEVPFFVVLVCGSGGHTAEMIKMVERSIRSEGPNSHRRWAIGYDDELSYKKVIDFERKLNARFTARNLHAGTFDIAYFRRSRAVHQSWLTTPLSVYHSANDVYNILTDLPANPAIPETKFPGVVATDGPGTGFVFLLCAYLMKFFQLVPDNCMKGVYVESWARVNSLSFSGKLIKFFQLAEVFVVQHPPLRRRNPRQAYTSNMVVMPTVPNVPMP